ncbi:MAG: uracil-DNA glycosylase family protein [Halomonadaceae bacterium]|nr:MAG: uracil-DNA glycosylase family protein [Halomonadaceae bacterium]
MASLPSLQQQIARCRLCRDCPTESARLPHEPRPVLQLGPGARICIASQAPGKRAHEKGLPFYDPSGVRLRQWLDMDEATFYDPDKLAIVPMGFCFPGYDRNGGDLPPRRECAPQWRQQVFDALPNLSLILLIGQYAQGYHLPREQRGCTLTETVANWRELLDGGQHPAVLPLPHPSWRNNGWLKRNPWFAEQLLPVLRQRVHGLLKE